MINFNFSEAQTDTHTKHDHSANTDLDRYLVLVPTLFEKFCWIFKDSQLKMNNYLMIKSDDNLYINYTATVIKNSIF